MADNIKTFRSGRHLAAFLGLVPKQNSSGGKERLQGISKRDDGYPAPIADPWCPGSIAPYG